MWPDLDRVRIYLRPGMMDMRKQINCLAAQASRHGQGNPFDGSLYLYCGRRGTMIKALYWDQNGFCLWTKRIEKSRFPWPKADDEAASPVVLERRDLDLILQGIDIRKRFRALKFSQIA